MVLFCIGELVARAWLTSPSAQDFDAELGWVWQPGATIYNGSEGGARLVINEHGLNDEAIGDAGYRTRILALGNSFTEAIQVPRAANFTTELERLTGADVVNLGRSAMTAAHYPIVLDRFMWTAPDRALVVVGEGDLTNILSDRVQVTRNPHGQITALRPVMEGKDQLKENFAPMLERSALMTWMMPRTKPVIMGWVSRWRGESTADAPPAEDPNAWIEASERLAFVLKTLNSRVPTTVVDLPHLRFLPGRKVSFVAEAERQAYRAAAAKAGVPYIDTYEALKAAYEDSGQPGYGFSNLTIGHGHLNEAGHSAVAKAIAAHLGSSHKPSGPPSAKPPGAEPRSRISAVWANDGGEKIIRRELRASKNPKAAHNTVWDGKIIQLFGAQNEVLSLNLVLEAKDTTARAVSVSFETLKGPGGNIGSQRRLGNGVFDFRGRNIELFFVRYLQIKGLSSLTWGNYDERHAPKPFRRPHNNHGIAKGTWEDRPHADAFYPDIAVPLEIVDRFNIPAATNQSIFADIYIPVGTQPGIYRGRVEVREAGKLTYTLPVSLEVLGFALPDRPHNKVMVQLGYSDPNLRYLGVEYPNEDKLAAEKTVRDRHFMMAHRHRIDLIDANHGPQPWTQDAPRPAWKDRLTGALFTAAHGYDGPGVGTPNAVFSIGTYGSWSWKDQGESGMHTHTDAWASWFAANAPETEVFLYLADESSDTPRIERWARWMRTNAGPGAAVLGLATIPLPSAVKKTPSLDVPTSSLLVGKKKAWAQALAAVRKDPRKRYYMYNGARPACGSMALEDDGIALRMNGWVQYKFDIDRWFYWESTYYKNYQGGMGQTNVFQQAHTFGGRPDRSEAFGEAGWNYTNGDGVLFYPGTDTQFPSDSYGLGGPIASLRLKHMRRGVQDADYLALAAKVDKAAVDALVKRMIPKVLWEYGVDNPIDPTYKHTDVSWSNDPAVWEKARRELATIIARGAPGR